MGNKEVRSRLIWMIVKFWSALGCGPGSERVEKGGLLE